MNYRMIRYTLGWIALFEGLFLLIPTIAALFYREREVVAFLWSIAACLSVALLLLLRKPKNTTLYSKEGFLVVALSWILLSLLGLLPFYISHAIPSFVDALFETVSGFTTTGASILSDVEALPKSLLLWRSFTHWVGGMGVLVFIMAFLPLSGGRNVHILKAESPGPSVSKLVPRVRTTALILYALYFILTLLQFILLLCGGMTVFEAFNTAVATAGTGGFGFRNDSMASFSPFLQNTITVFMLLFSVNFSSYYLALKGKWRECFSAEVKVFFAVVAVSGVFVAFNIRPLCHSLADAFRYGFFSVATIISTTGFSVENFDLWPNASRTLLVLLMFVGACAGSTGGGIKISRVIIAAKNIFRELHLALHPRHIRTVSVDRHPIDREVSQSVNVYFLCFISVFLLSVFALSFDSGDLVTNFTAVAATINNIGPGLSLVGPAGNYAFFSVPSKLVLIFDMLAGRLELFPMLLLFSPASWKRQ